MQAHLHRPLHPARRAAVVALLAMVVLAQTLGWMHRALHGDAGAGRHDAAVIASDTAGHAEAAHDDGLHALFGSHAEASDCRLFDVLGQPGCTATPLLVLPVLLPATRLALTHADFVARWAALFDARGPPPSR